MPPPATVAVRHRRTGELLYVVPAPDGTLRNADLARAQLAGADLHGMDLRGAHLVGANLSDADLRGADLREASVLEARFTGAIYDGGTRWPRHFRPRWSGCVRQRSAGEVVPAARPEGNEKEPAPPE
jgi:hypothetical protein